MLEECHVAWMDEGVTEAAFNIIFFYINCPYKRREEGVNWRFRERKAFPAHFPLPVLYGTKSEDVGICLVLHLSAL